MCDVRDEILVRNRPPGPLPGRDSQEPTVLAFILLHRSFPLARKTSVWHRDHNAELILKVVQVIQ